MYVIFSIKVEPQCNQGDEIGGSLTGLVQFVMRVRIGTSALSALLMRLEISNIVVGPYHMCKRMETFSFLPLTFVRFLRLRYVTTP